MSNHPLPTVLSNATDKMLEKAVADNHQQLFTFAAIAKGGSVKTAEGITWTFIGYADDGIISFPALNPVTAGVQLDEVMDYFRSHGSQAPHTVACWSLDPPQPADLGIRLLARGFQPGWQPCWMALDLNELNITKQTDSIIINQDNHTSITDIDDLPYKEDGAYMSQSLLTKYPEVAYRFLAFSGEEIVGQICIFLTTGEMGVAGIYNVGVLPTYRNKGFGKALVIAACTFAKEKGYMYAVLNANHIGRPLYERVGFRFLSYGMTWWLMEQTYVTNPPPHELIVFAEAVGSGDIESLNILSEQGISIDLNTPLTNKMTLLQLAIHYKQSAATKWLIDHGATYTVLDAWDLGWKEKAAIILNSAPEELGRRYFEWQGTLLHVAIERNDIPLAELALEAGVDPLVRDTQHNGNAMGWALHFNRPEIIKLIRAQAGYADDYPEDL